MKDKQINLGTYSLFSTVKSILLFIAFLFMFKMYLDKKEDFAEIKNLYEASEDKIQTYKDKNGDLVSKIAIMETRDKKTFIAFKSQDSTIQELQRLVKRNGRLFRDSKGSASIIKSETKIDTTTKTSVTFDIKNSPIYKSFTKNKWYSIKSTATKDSTKVSVRTFHNLSIVMGSESQGLFKKRKSFAIARDKNPYSNIKDMRIYNVVKDNKHFVIGPNIGYSLTFIDNNVKSGFNIGFGVTYKLMEF